MSAVLVASYRFACGGIFVVCTPASFVDIMVLSLCFVFCGGAVLHLFTVLIGVVTGLTRFGLSRGLWVIAFATPRVFVF